MFTLYTNYIAVCEEKKKLLELNLPKEIKTEKNVKINDVDLIANEFNDFFLSVG